MNERKIGQRINAALATNKMLQKELAKILDVTDNTISYFCSGARTPKIEQIVKIAQALNVTTDYLLGLTDDPSPKPCAVDELGLSTEAIKNILDLQPEENSVARLIIPKDAIPILNWIICNINHDFLLTYLSNLSKRAKEYQDEKTKIDSETDGGYERFAAYRDATDKLDLEKYRANKMLDRLFDYFIEDYCLHLIDHSKPTWWVSSDDND